MAPPARLERRDRSAWRVGECRGDVGESESSAPDVRIRSDFYAKERMTQIYLNGQLKIFFFLPYRVLVLKHSRTLILSLL